LAADFSLPLPILVMCDLLGVPTADMGQFHAWSGKAIGVWESDPGQAMAAS
jgi:cytochrome P450